MSIELPNEYVIQQMYLYAGYPKVEHTNDIVSAGCPTCHEGRSWGVKRRLMFMVKERYFFCHNCSRSWKPVNWVMEVSGKTFKEVMNESREYEYIPADLIYKEQVKVVKESDILPLDSINLFDAAQVHFYNKNQIVKDALDLIHNRKLDIAVNRPNTFYLSLTDHIHKNRLCIPFIGLDNKIDFYQTRTILKSDDFLPKYLGKSGGSKSLFGINNISEELDYIFIFEGPIDACFVKNSVAIGGVTINEIQKNQLRQFPFHKQVWVLDNQFIDTTARERTKELVEAGETVFIWPKSEELKDFNDLAIKSDVSEIPPEFILTNTASGLQAKLRIKQLGL